MPCLFALPRGASAAPAGSVEPRQSTRSHLEHAWTLESTNQSARDHEKWATAPEAGRAYLIRCGRSGRAPAPKRDAPCGCGARARMWGPRRAMCIAPSRPWSILHRGRDPCVRSASCEPVRSPSPSVAGVCRLSSLIVLRSCCLQRQRHAFDARPNVTRV